MRRSLLLIAMAALAMIPGLSLANGSTDVAVREHPPGEMPDTIWSWWIHPLAVADGDAALVGGLGSGVVKVWRVEPDRTLEASWPAVGVDDDHNAPAIAVHPQHPALVFYTGHNYDNQVRWRTIDRDMNVSGEQVLTAPGNTTYVQPVTYGDTVALFTRVNRCSWYAITSNDWGTTWGDWVKVVDDCDAGGLIYLTTAPSSLGPEFYRIAIYGHPSLSEWREIDTGLLDMDTGRITRVHGGKPVGYIFSGRNLPVERGDLFTAYTPPDGTITRLLDVGESPDGDPLVAFATWDDWDVEGTGKYRTARYDGDDWVVSNSLPATGSPFQDRDGNTKRGYVGGMTITDTGDVVLSREVEIAGGASQWRLERYRIGTGWELQAAEQYFTPLVRPYAVRGADDVVVHRLNRYPAVDADAFLTDATLTVP